MFKECNQFHLIPQNYKDFLWDSHEAVILDEIINELDLWELIDKYKNNLKWTSAYHPRMLLKVLFYWYMNQTFSSRKIASKLKSDLWFMFLSWNNQSNFRTINRFRKEKLEILEKLFTQIIFKAQKLWLIEFWTVSLDWTKIYANASKYNNNDIDWLDKKIKKLFEEAEKIDKLEDQEFWEDNEDKIPKELKTKEWRDKKRKEIEEKEKDLKNKKEEVKKEIEEKQKSWIKQERINSTDKDSRLVMMKRKDFANWYNPQIITENQIILTTTVPNTSNDTEELVPIFNKFKEQYNTLPKICLADKWYWNEKWYEYLEDNNIESYIPHQENNWISIDNYTYNEKADTYEDKQWNIFKFKQYYGRLDWTKKKGRPKKDEVSKEEDFKWKQYMTTLENWTKKYLEISKNLKSVYKRNDERLYSEKWKEIYKKRSWSVEPVFGNIKHNLWFERFLLRWFKWVQIEWNLISLAHNLKKMIKLRVS